MFSVPPAPCHCETSPFLCKDTVLMPCALTSPQGANYRVRCAVVLLSFAQDLPPWLLYPQLGSTAPLHPHAIITELVTISEAHLNVPLISQDFRSTWRFLVSYGSVSRLYLTCLFGHSFSMYLGGTCVQEPRFHVHG